MVKVRKMKKKNVKSNRIKFKGDMLYGIHACTEALKNPDRKVHAIYVSDRIWNGDRRNKVPGLMHDLQDSGELSRLPQPRIIEKKELDGQMPKGAVHQGIVLDLSAPEEVFLSDIIVKSKMREKTTLVMLDQVTDPHNIGAILRSAAAFGAVAIIAQSRHTPDINALMAKIACGAVEHVPIVQVVNLSEGLEKLKAEGFTCIGLDEHTDKVLSDIPRNDKTIIVLGAEGKGIRPKVADTCTDIAKLPTQPPIASLNVSNAAAIALYELN